MNKFKVKVEPGNERSDSKNDRSTLANSATIVIEPLEAGYGHTLGNSLRRCLLTSLPGAAVSAVKITGVSHQFSTIPGVVEDAIEIILNVKKVRVKVFSDERTSPGKSVQMRITKTGLGPVKASDIDTLGQGEIVNGDLHIATLTDPKVKLNIELTVEQGVGYLTSDDKKANEIGVMPVDSIFSPIVSVNYSVDQTRVGRRTDFDKLNLEVTTDGSITPLEAVQKAAQILSDYFRQVYEPSAEAEEEVPATSFSMMNDDVNKASIEELDLPVRITNALKAIEIDTIGKLLTVNPSQLMKAKNLGAKSLNLISEKLSERRLTLGEA